MDLLGHGHHVGLLTRGRRYAERRDQIIAVKPRSEHAIRLRCMWVVTPEQIADLPSAVADAYRACDEAYRARDEAYRAREEAYCDYDDAYRACDEASRAYAEAYRACEEAYCDYRSEMEAWHARHCPALRTPEGCPWDGERLVGVGDW